MEDKEFVVTAPAASLQLRHVDGKPYIPEPPLSKEKTKIWQSQVLIPFRLDDEPHDFLGTLPSDVPSEIHVDDEGAFFSTSQRSSPLITSTNPISLQFVDRNFCTAPPLHCPRFGAWMDRLERHKGQQWRATGIYDLLRLARAGTPYSSGMLLAALYFWEGATNTFHIKCDMITPTLLDVAALTGVTPAGVPFI